MDYMVIQEVAGVIHSVFGHGKEAFIPYFSDLAPYFLEMLKPNRHFQDLQWSLCVFCDLIEFTPSVCINTGQISLTMIGIFKVCGTIRAPYG